MKGAINYLTSFDTPEALFSINPEAPEGLHIDALDAALARAEAICALLCAVSSDLNDGYIVNQKTVCDGLWTLQSLIEQARTIVHHA